jgi:hypothetical protein
MFCDTIHYNEKRYLNELQKITRLISKRCQIWSFNLDYLFEFHSNNKFNEFFLSFFIFKYNQDYTQTS